MGSWTPDRYFDRISSIDIEHDLCERGLTCALLDIDNTLRSRADGLVPADVRTWLAEARMCGISVCLLSNNLHRNVFELAADLEVPCLGKALKPLPFGFLRAMRQMGAARSETVVIGDQVWTDVVGAKWLGLTAYLVAPLADVDLWYTQLIRKLEARLKGRRSKTGEGEAAPAFTKTSASRKG